MLSLMSALPDSITSTAFVASNGEFGWRREDIERYAFSPDLVVDSVADFTSMPEFLEMQAA